MGIFDRMGKVISSNFNALLDKAEDPRKSIDLTLDEMHQQLKAARHEVVRSVAAEKQLRKKVEELDEQVTTWEKRAELAVRHGDDELAREALMQKRRVTAERDRAEALRAEQRGNALEMKRELERMETKVEEISAKKGTLVAKAQQAKIAAETSGAGGVGGSAFAEFRRMEDQIEGVETALAAQNEIDSALREDGPTGMSRADIEAKFRALEGSGTYGEPGKATPTSAVDEELSALKKKIRIDS
ncbi:MAG TPA: PspA/IM30 family protein [Polyangiaceae bacterium]|nr:PspA/IM30 family protein [Polyangiaceae bacterium]